MLFRNSLSPPPPPFCPHPPPTYSNPPPTSSILPSPSSPPLSSRPPPPSPSLFLSSSSPTPPPLLYLPLPHILPFLQKLHLLLLPLPSLPLLLFSDLSIKAKDFTHFRNTMEGGGREISLFLDDLAFSIETIQKRRDVLEFIDEKGFLSELIRIIPCETLNYVERPGLSKVFAEIFRFFQTKGVDAKKKEQIFIENVLLWLYGISFPDTPSILHSAVFNSDLPVLHRLCTRESLQLLHLDLNAPDPLGLTPLQLAVRLGNADACLVLIDAGADPNFRGSRWLRSPLEEAKFREDVGGGRGGGRREERGGRREEGGGEAGGEMGRGWKEKERRKEERGRMTKEGRRRVGEGGWDVERVVEEGGRRRRWEEQRRRAGKVLGEIPDFKGEVRWECESRFLPFAKRIAPSDCYKIFKRGDRIRVDLTLKSWTGGKCIRGSNSVIFDGLQQKMWMVDHERRRAWEEENGGGGRKREEEGGEGGGRKEDEGGGGKRREEEEGGEVLAENIEFYQNYDWKGSEVREMVGGVETIKYGVKGKLIIKKERGEIWENLDWEEWEDFEEYWRWGEKNGLSKKLGLNGSN